ncbi:MAG TPA: HEAT repeat domain-containing protein [Anaerolineales bacterium]|nr:HEAT repeat domain-containing protein [Anaerolineales bacterium]
MPSVDLFSFWLGFAAAWAVVFALWTQRRALAGLRARLLDGWGRLRVRLTAGTEHNYREDVRRFAQSAHLAGALFTLDSLAIAPRFMQPPPAFDPSAPPPDDDLNTIIPALPDWPELAGIYDGPTLGLRDILVGGEPLVVLGGLGSGKTTALAQIASLAATGDEALFPTSPTPIFVHAADLDFAPSPKADSATPLLAAAQARVSLLTSTNLTRHLRMRLQRAACLVLIDGLDELPFEGIQAVGDWLKGFREAYPQHRVIAACGLSGFGPLTALGFAPVYIAPPNAQATQTLTQNWLREWQNGLSRNRKRGALDIDPSILLGWLNIGGQGRTVGELTLRIWGALSGDIPGPRPADWLSAFVRRHALNATERTALQLVAIRSLNRRDGAGIPRVDAREILLPLVTKSASGKAELEPGVILDSLMSRRLLTRLGRERIGFTHGLLAVHFAAEALEEATQAEPETHPLWSEALGLYAAHGDLTPIAARLLQQPADALHTQLFTIAGWLRDAPVRAPWRGEVFKRLSRLMLDKVQPETLRLRALAALVASQDPTVARLFAQTLAGAEPFARRMAALGLGALREPGAVPQLAAALNDPYLDVRWAAALALAVIGSDAAIDTLRRGVEQSDLSIKLAAAQALARNPEHGFTILSEALAQPGHDTRRAAYFGLADTRLPEAQALLEQGRISDPEWLVRNAAAELVEARFEKTQPAPVPFTPPEQQAWLIAWAAALGAGVPPGRGAIDLLNRALLEGEPEIRIAAAEALAMLGDPVAARELYRVLGDPREPLVRDAAFRALVAISAQSGQRLAAFAVDGRNA